MLHSKNAWKNAIGNALAIFFPHRAVFALIELAISYSPMQQQSREMQRVKPWQSHLEACKKNKASKMTFTKRTKPTGFENDQVVVKLKQ